MIRILHILSNLSLRSGVANVIINYLRCIDRTKIQFSIIYYDEIEGKSHKSELASYNVNFCYFRRRSFRKDLNRFCRDNFGNFDIVEIHEPFIAPVLIGIKKKLGVKKVIFHSHSTRMSDSKIKEFRNKFLSIPSTWIADNYMACSRAAGNKAFGNKFDKKGFVVYNAIDLKRFEFNSETRIKIREQYSISDKTVVGHVGNMTPPKNHFFLLKVFNEFLKSKHNAILMLIGEGYLKGEIKNRASELGIIDNIVFVGLVDNVGDYLNAMDVFVFPSLFEGLGIALVEAQTNGLRCVFSDTIPNEANLNTKANTVLSLKSNPKTWAKALIAATGRNAELMEDYAYDITRAGKRLEKIYETILGGNNEET